MAPGRLHRMLAEGIVHGDAADLLPQLPAGNRDSAQAPHLTEEQVSRYGDNKTAAASVADYPTGPVRLVEPFGPGGGVEVLAGPVASKLSQLWGQQVVIENCPGAGSTAAPKFVAASPADGYTLLVNTSAHAYSAAAVADLPYDPLKDFVAVAALTKQAYVLVAAIASGIRTVADLIAQAKSRPGQLTFASAGVGTGTHLAAASLNLAAGILTVHRPADSGDDIAATIAKTAYGATDFAMSPIPIAAPHIRRGSLIALGTTAILRSPLLPEVPTIAEAGLSVAGLSGYDFPIWYGLWAPAGTPPAIADKIAMDVAAVLGDSELRDWLTRHGAEPITMTRAKFTDFVVEESQRAARILHDAN
jgi:tripartite-type tricarboxylate transporter receptor subunit TctC